MTDHQSVDTTELPPAGIEARAAANVEIIGYRPYSKNTLAGFVDLRLPNGLVINGAVLHQHCGRCWVSLPALRRAEGGRIRYFPLIKFASDAARIAFQSAALRAVSAYLATNGTGVRL